MGVIRIIRNNVVVHNKTNELIDKYIKVYTSNESSNTEKHRSLLELKKFAIRGEYIKRIIKNGLLVNKNKNNLEFKKHIELALELYPTYFIEDIIDYHKMNINDYSIYEILVKNYVYYDNKESEKLFNYLLNTLFHLILLFLVMTL